MEYSSREIIGMLAADGWQEVACVGSHHHFKHPKKARASYRAASEAVDSYRNGKKHFQTGGY